MEHKRAWCRECEKWLTQRNVLNHERTLRHRKSIKSPYERQRQAAIDATWERLVGPQAR